MPLHDGIAMIASSSSTTSLHSSSTYAPKSFHTRSSSLSPLSSPTRGVTSPILSSSVFAEFDYFLSDHSPPSSANTTPSLASSSSPSPSSSSNSSPLHRARTTIHRPRSYLAMPSFDAAEIDLTSPQALGSPVLADVAKMPERRSVHILEKPNVVNWARPLRQSDPVESYAPMFGASSQRAKRLNRASPMSNSTPSPLSSGDMPHTPPTPDSTSMIGRGWSLPPVSEGKGLGFGSEFEWNETMPTSYSGSALADYLDSASPCSSTRGSPTPTQSRIISSSDSLTELSSPSNLAELRHLRQAALDLEAQVRGKPTSYRMSSPTPVVSVRERRIKRKAVPSLDLGDISTSRTITSSASTPTLAIRMHTLIPDVSPLDSSRPKASALPFPQSSTSSKSDTTPKSPRTPQRPFYANITGAQSVLEISPRTSSLPFFSNSPSAHKRMASTPSTIGSCHSSASSETDEPITPHSMTDKEGFISQMEASLRSLNMASGSMIDLGRYRDQTVRGEKQRKGISRFFKKSLEV